MGFRVLLIAVRDKDPARIRAEYGVAETGEFSEIAEAPVCGAPLPDGGYLLYVNDEIDDFTSFGRLSAGTSLLACYAHEGTMQSLACGWTDGEERWSILHDAQRDIAHLEASGEPPAAYERIRDFALGEQSEDDDVDFRFDVPVNLFAAEGGIRYDQDPEGAGPEPWQVLARIPPESEKKKRWWSFR